MATQIASLHTSRRIPIHPTRRKRTLLRRAAQLFELIGAYSDACTVEELQILRDYIDMFLELPDPILRDWEKS